MRRHASTTSRPSRSRASAVDARTDVYALGCVLFQMLTGDVAFPARLGGREDASRTLNEPPPSVLRAGRSAPRRQLDAVIERAMAKEPGRSRLPCLAGDLAQGGRGRGARGPGAPSARAHRSRGARPRRAGVPGAATRLERSSSRDRSARGIGGAIDRGVATTSRGDGRRSVCRRRMSGARVAEGVSRTDAAPPGSPTTRSSRARSGRRSSYMSTG